MHQVTGDYPDYKKANLKSNFYLDADKAFNPYTWAPPIEWEGIVGGQKVKFTQISSKGNNKIDYNWDGFPDDLAGAIPYIVEAIDNAMRTMD